MARSKRKHEPGKFADSLTPLAKHGRTSYDEPGQPHDQPFRHSPLNLDTNNIRLFHILHNEEGISLALRHDRISTLHTAVSYVCGPALPTYQILINRRPYRVGYNLYGFLFQMKQSRRIDAFWVDAICIEQDDSKEKNHQVRQMWRMYAEARQVCLWLGSGDTASQELFYTLGSSYVPQGEGSCPRCTRRRKDDAFTIHSLRCHQDTILRMLSDDYWTRMWIIQELFFGRNKGMLTMGPSDIYVSEFVEKIQRFFKREVLEGVLASPGWLLLEGDNLKHAVKADESRSADIDDDPSSLEQWWFSRLLYLLRDLGHCECTDARDRIYVLLALLGDTAGKLIDYDLSEKEIYAKMLDTWMTVLHHEVSSLEAFARVEKTVRLALKLSHQQSRQSLALFQQTRPLWTFALRLATIWVTNDTVPPSLFLQIPGLGLPERHRDFETCSCPECRATSLPANQPLYVLSAGEERDWDDEGPFLIIGKNEKRILALAYGRLKKKRGHIKIFHPSFLNQTSAILSLDCLMDVNHETVDMEDDHPYCNVDIQPMDLLKLVYKLKIGTSSFEHLPSLHSWESPTVREEKGKEGRNKGGRKRKGKGRKVRSR